MTTENALQIERQQARKIAQLLGYIVEEDFQILAKATPGTVEAWRKRGLGPAYVRIGNRVLYSLDDLELHLASIKRNEKNKRGDAL